MQITRSSTEGATGKGPAECFTGDVYIDSVAGPAPAMSWTDTVVQVRRFLGCWTCVRHRPESVRRIGCPHGSASRSYQRDDQEFGRAIGFFDATYALALTLLVTTLDIAEPSSAWATLSALWDAVGPQFLAFGISFAVISSYWLAHHRLVRTLAAVDQPTIIANLVLVASIVVIPFSTNAVGDPGVEDLPLPTAFLAVNIAIASGLHTLVYMLAYRRKLFLVRPSAREV
jgi:uncharacterized membrane protein